MTSNFSQNQMTGTVSEDEVGLLFMRWGWTVGRDRIDVGYDFFIEPDRLRYQGMRFLVQVKGTTQRRQGTGLIAPVKKSRLAEYVRNPHAVFLVRVAPDCRFYWLHVQEWAKGNRSRLAGSGTAHIPMDAAHDLSDREAFEAYLDKVLAPASHRLGALASMAEERAAVLSALDPRFLVQVNVKEGREEHEVFAKSETVETNFSFQADRRTDNVSNLKEALGFGLPRKVEVSQFHMSGSPLFEALGVNQPHTGTLTIRAKPRRGVVRLYPGHTFSPMSQCLEIDADLYAGQKGIAISSEALDGLFQVEARFNLPGRGNATFSLNQNKLTSAPIQDLSQLAAVGAWAEQVAEEQAMFPELVFDDRRARLQSSDMSIESIGSWLYELRMLSRLHLIAKCLDLDFIVPDGFTYSEEEAREISFAYHLLRGARLSGGSVSMEVEPSGSAMSMKTPHSPYGFWATTNIVLTVGGREFAALPVAIDLPDYVFEPVPGSKRLRVYHPDDGEAWITYAPDGPDDVFVRRVAKADP